MKTGSGIPRPIDAAYHAIYDPKFCRGPASSEVVSLFVGINPVGEIGDDKEDEI